MDSNSTDSRMPTVVKIAIVEQASSTHSNILSTLLRARSCGAMRRHTMIAPSMAASERDAPRAPR